MITWSFKITNFLSYNLNNSANLTKYTLYLNIILTVNNNTRFRLIFFIQISAKYFLAYRLK